MPNKAASKKKARRSPGARPTQAKIAKRALAMKLKAKSSAPRKPSSATPGQGMRPLPNKEIAPSGALKQEGQRPVLERSRKVR